MDGKKLKIAIASDHAGFLLKEHLCKFLISEGYNVTDFGTDSEEAVDYTDIAYKTAKAVADGNYDRAIIICGTGLGVSMVANKIPNIRAALCNNTYMARMSREHNDANIICLGARVIGQGLAQDTVLRFLETEFEKGGRHSARVDKINALDCDSQE